MDSFERLRSTLNDVDQAKPATDPTLPDPEYLRKIANATMPFGKFKGRFLIDLPEPYLAWFAREGFPEGEIGVLLGSLFEIKQNGLDYLLRPLQDRGG